MKLKSIQLKIALVAGICLLATAAALVFYGLAATAVSKEYVKSHVSALVDKATRDHLLTLAGKQAALIEGKLETNLDAARAMAQTFTVLRRDLGSRADGTVDVRAVINGILPEILRNNPEFLGAYTAWEPNALDSRDREFAGNASGGYDGTGRFIPYWNRNERGEIARQPLVDYENQEKHPSGVRKGGWYLVPKETGKESVLDPFPYIVQGKTEWLTSISVPITADGKFLGVAGTDLRLGFLQDLSREVDQNLYGGKCSITIISNMGLVAASSDRPEMIGRPLKDLMPNTWETFLSSIQAGKADIALKQATEQLRVLAPIKMGRTGKPWAVLIQVPQAVVLADAHALDAELSGRARTGAFWQVGVGLAVTAAALLCLWLFTGGVVRPIRQAATFARQVEKGDFSHRLDVHQDDEVGVLADAMREMVDELKQKIGFSDGVVKSIVTPFMIVGPDGRIAYVNAQAVALYGRTGKPEDHVGKSAGEFVYGDASRPTVSARVLAERKALHGIHAEIESKGGRRLHVQFDGSPIFDLDGVLTGALTMMTDLTEIRSKQAEIQEKNEQMAKVAQQAEAIAGTVSTAADELAALVEQSSRGAEAQKGRLGETATAMTQMTSSVMEVAQNASRAAESSGQAKNKAQEGSDVVLHAVDAIGSIHEQAKALKENMAHLGKQADDIGKIMDVISDIADQTNLLALNAAIEAARAGEAGKGFAVVADEVRKLAEKTMNATREVGQAVQSIQEGAKSSMHSADGTADMVERASSLANDSGRALTEIVDVAEAAADQVRSIATASEEQSAASEQINHSVEEISRISTETADAMDRSMRAVTALASQAQALRELIRRI